MWESRKDTPNLCRRIGGWRYASGFCRILHFLQRSYDQIIHDAAMQHMKVVLAIDRAGLVGEDGETHQGVFDTAFLNEIPEVTVFSPSYFQEIKPSLQKALYGCSGVAAVRYPRGGEGYRPAGFLSSGGAF